MKERGITLIALIITIIILLILAGVTINVILGENGLFSIAKQAGEDYKQAGAREKLEAVLVELQADKITKSEYNEKDYIDNRLKQNNMEVEGNIVTVEGWQFEIDRSIPEIAQSLGKETEFKKDTRGKAKFVYDTETKNVAKVEVTIEIDASISGYTVQYNIVENSDTSTNWVDYTAGSTIEVRKNITIYGRIIDKTTKEVGYKFSGKISTIDETVPQAATITFDKEKVNVDETIEATVTQSDLESGIDITNCKYIVNQSSDELGKDNEAWNSAPNFNENPKNISITESNLGTYYLHVLSIDRAGNKTEKVSTGIKFKGTITFMNISSGSNLPGNWIDIKSSGNLRFNCNGSSSTMLRYPTLVEVTDLNKITFTWKGNWYCAAASGAGSTGRLKIGLFSDANLTEEICTETLEKTGWNKDLGQGSISVEVSDVVGKYYLGISFTLGSVDGACYISGPYTVIGE